MKTPFRARFAAPALTALVAIAASLGACGPAPRETSGPESHAHVHPEDLQGPLTPHVQGIQYAAAAAANAQPTSCEARLAGVQKLLAKALDERGQKVELPVIPASSSRSQFENSSSRPEVPGVVWYTLGKARYFHDQRAPLQPDELKWKEEIKSWEKAYLLYLEIRDKPMDPRWENLNIRVRSLILDDRRRLIDQIDYTVSKDDIEDVKRLDEQVRGCQREIHCLQIPLDEGTRRQIERSPKLRALFERLEREPVESKKRIVLLDFASATWSEVYRVVFEPNATISRKDEKSIVLPLDPGILEDVPGSKERLELLLEDFWSSPQLKIDVEWRSAKPGQPASSQPYRFDFSLSAGERAFVDPASRTIRLSPEGSITTIFHEIGHVLGLPDRYYNVWDPQNCAYVLQSRPGDIMSKSERGQILESDWSLLDAEYPWVSTKIGDNP